MKLLSFFALATAIIFAGCDVTVTTGGGSAANALQGSGTSKTEDREVTEFDSIVLYGAGTVNVSLGESPKLTVSADDNLLELIESKVEEGQLKIKPTESISAKSDLVYEITTNSLTKLVVDGAAKVNLNDVKGSDLTLEVNGAASASGSGEVDQLTIATKGASSVKLQELHAKTLNVKLAGAGSATVFASESVDAEIAGVGSIIVHGNPADVNKQVNGLGTIKIVD